MVHSSSSSLEDVYGYPHLMPSLLCQGLRVALAALGRSDAPPSASQASRFLPVNRAPIPPARTILVRIKHLITTRCGHTLCWWHNKTDQERVLASESWMLLLYFTCRTRRRSRWRRSQPKELTSCVFLLEHATGLITAGVCSLR